MAEGTNIASAYVQIVPSAKGMGKAIAEEIDGSDVGHSSGESLGKKLMSGLKTVFTAAAIGKIVKDAIGEGSALQQSIGGVETLFDNTENLQRFKDSLADIGYTAEEIENELKNYKDPVDVVMENAANAYKTAGLSANQYMETVTGMAAALNQSTGDLAVSADMADMAITDMADNANKMGSSMESIQTAYSGFAKQNYTMLDNLKLGYGGTKEEMERLLADAQKISGVEYDVSSYADIVEAIHVVQTEMGITGTTAAEASSTFTGSFSAMQASVKNLLGNLTLGEDIGPSLEALGESISTFLFDNLFPMIGNILMGLPDLLFGGGAGLIDQLVWRIVEEAPKLGEGALKLMLSLVDGVLRNIPQLLNAAFVLVGSFAKSLWDAITGYDWASYFRPILDKATEIWNGIKETVINLWNTVKGRFESLFTSVKNIWEKIKNAIITPVKNVWEKIKEFIGKIKDIFSGLKLELPKIALPHFSVYGGKFPWGIGGSGEAPRFSVDWYDKGGIFREPSIIGVGEKRPEFVGALEDLRDIVREEAGGRTEINMNVYGTDGQNINELADRVMDRLQFAIDRKERQFA